MYYVLSLLSTGWFQVQLWVWIIKLNCLQARSNQLDYKKYKQVGNTADFLFYVLNFSRCLILLNNSKTIFLKIQQDFFTNKKLMNIPDKIKFE